MENEMITKQELEKLKQTGCCLIAREGSEQPNSHEHHICDCTVLRLIEALEVATEALNAYADANSQYAQEALNKIYGV